MIRTAKKRVKQPHSTEEKINQVLTGDKNYSFLFGDAKTVLKKIPSDSVDCVITSPPYWKLREYDIEADQDHHLIGDESDPKEYVLRLVEIFNEVKRVLKEDGSFWLNIGDKYVNKNLMGMPWRVALAMQDEGWILRNDIIWDQMKGTQSAKDRMRDVYEHVFHFVKSRKYYFNKKDILIKPAKQAQVTDRVTISATGVSGKKYRKLIHESIFLTETEKQNAENALDDVLARVRAGEINDFRMTIRGQQRTYHSESTKVSGRAKELELKGYFFIIMKAEGFLPSDIWRIVPEDKWRKDAHCAVFPEELLQTPILSTSRPNGIVLDPFSGTGSTVAAAVKHGRKGLGIDLSTAYLKVSQQRISDLNTLL